MSGRARQLAVGVFIGLYILWPFVHQQLVLHYRVNPWKLAGWGMYTTAQPRIGIKLIGIDSAGQRFLLRPDTTPELSAAVGRYKTYRRTLGLLVDSSDLAERVASTYRQHARFALVVDEYGLTEEDWIGQTHHAQYRYQRAANGLVEPVSEFR